MTDRQILQTLAHLGRPSNNNQRELQDFRPEDIFTSIAMLLNGISRDSGHDILPTDWPESLPLRYNQGIQMAEAIEALGYDSGDIGYQIFIHEGSFSLKELRHLLNFLMEKLPLTPTTCFTHEEKSSSSPLEISKAQRSSIHGFPLLHRHSRFLSQEMGDVLSHESLIACNEAVQAARNDLCVLDLGSEKGEDLGKEVDLKKELEIKNNRKESLQSQIHDLNIQLAQIGEAAKETEDSIDKTSRRITVLGKASRLSEDEGSIPRLEALLEKRRDKRRVLQGQWEEGIGPLEREREGLILRLQELKKGEISRTAAFSRISNEILATAGMLRIKETELEERKRMLSEQNEGLLGGEEQLRSFYTDKILAATSDLDVKSQRLQEEIDALKSLQKEINSLTSQLERAFTETEARVFAAASRDTPGMLLGLKALLKWWDSASNDLMPNIRAVGRTQRDIAELERKIARESSRDFEGKIERVKKDIQLLSRRA